MPTYVSLVKKTEQGREIDAKDVRERQQLGRDLIEEHGGEEEAVYYGLCRYDFIGVWDFPDTESVAKLQLAAEQTGLLDFETFEVFTPDEWDTILEDALG